MAENLPSPKEAFMGFFLELGKQLMKKSKLDMNAPVSSNEAKELLENDFEEVLLRALFATGGITKLMGMGKPLIQLGKEINTDPGYGANRAKGITAWGELPRIPKNEFGKLDDVQFDSNLGLHGGVFRRQYFGQNIKKSVILNPSRADPNSVWHEFTHSRDYHDALGLGGKIRSYNGILETATKENRGKLPIGMNFYYDLSPIEAHARATAGDIMKLPAKNRQKAFPKISDKNAKLMLKQLDELFGGIEAIRNTKYTDIADLLPSVSLIMDNYN